MNKNDLITCFNDTYAITQSDDYLKATTRNSIISNKVYKENFISSKLYRNLKGDIYVNGLSTLKAASHYRNNEKIAILNFANPYNPGGGVFYGARAQEESICRCSNLYNCLIDKNVYDDFYLYNKSLNSEYNSDRCIYTKAVSVFKEDVDIPILLNKTDWYKVDVITCAAPMTFLLKKVNIKYLLYVFKKRIKNIFEVARDNDVDILILGAFGCGAFKNNPILVAKAFEQVIVENDYLKCFKRIVFSIKSSGEEDINYSVFDAQFDKYEAERQGRAMLIPYGISDLYDTLPKFEYLVIQDYDKYEYWRYNNPYYMKQISILGDSISTLSGVIPNDYIAFYCDDNYLSTGVKEVDDTWWGKLAKYLGAEILVNNSYSGSRVTKNNAYVDEFPSGCSNKRIQNLHLGEINPDVIIVFLGINDWANGVKILNENVVDLSDNTFFSNAYDSMIRSIRKKYIDSEIWCCTLPKSYMSAKQSFVFLQEYGGIHIDEYNKVIKLIAGKEKCKLIDISNSNRYDSIDGTHPNKLGMEIIAANIIGELLK